MKKTLTVLLIISAITSYAQVNRKIIVEHFTNTICGNCAGANPGFFTNVNNQSGVIHMSVHPSAPYSGCLLHQHNTTQNNARTNYYGIFGSTPRLVIQGTVIASSANYSLSTIFTPYLSQTSPASIRIEQTKYGNDSIRSTVIVKTVAAHSLGNLSLFVALAEDTIFYNSPNGETHHYNVFRKSLTAATGLVVTLPATIGDSIVYTMSSLKSTAWNFSRIYTLAVLQETTSKAVVQAESVPANLNTTITAIKNKKEDAGILVYLNDKILTIENSTNTKNLRLKVYNIQGQKVINKSFDQSKHLLNIENIPAGIYLYELNSADKIFKTGKIIIN